jgi:hypothetical protein
MKKIKKSLLRMDAANLTDKDGCQVFLEFYNYKKGLDAMFEAFSAAERDGVSLKAALGIIGNWFERDFNHLTVKAAEYVEDGCRTLEPPPVEVLMVDNWPAPPRKGFRDLVPDGLRVKEHDEP